MNKPEIQPEPLPVATGSDWEDDDCGNTETVTCGMCGDDGWIMLSDAGPSEWGEDCFCEVDRLIECPECRDRRRYEAQQANRQNDPSSVTRHTERTDCKPQ